MRALPKLFVAAALAAAASTAAAADECRATIFHFGDGAARRPKLTTVAVLSVGDVTRQRFDWLASVRNDGPHDIRVVFQGAPTRQLARGKSDPAHGDFGARIALAQIECLATRSALSKSRQTPPPDEHLAAHQATPHGASR